MYYTLDSDLEEDLKRFSPAYTSIETIHVSNITM